MGNIQVTDARFLIRNIGKSLVFNGTSDYATIPITPLVTGFKTSFWFKTDVLVPSVNSIILNWLGGGPANGFWLREASGTNAINLNIYNAAVATTNIATSTGVKKVGVWHHLLVEFLPNNCSVYIDGSLVATDTGCSMTTVAETLTIGKRSNAASQYFKGKIADLMFINSAVALTSDEINAIHKKGMKLTGSSWWNFNDTVTDSSSNGKTITLSGTAYSADVPSFGAVRTSVL